MHVCKTLSPQNESGLQTCLEWQEQKPFLPNLTVQQADQMLVAIVGCFAVVFIVKQVISLLK
ncbi:MAG: hypothetical protein GAK29_00410 [Acinetobacter bereziniae]|uniref:Uncharacterized protein n=1 Tax=Acinetobacter bereziniae TaxID=106648 RepID=A0A833PI71_ACIBZ|nr:MAG: hypothetical protein GAK29_00410 [Acinetobacter bereziniae]